VEILRGLLGPEETQGREAEAEDVGAAPRPCVRKRPLFDDDFG
jgi:hypothetical protein